MSTKKRFEQIEPQMPAGNERSSFLGKLRFRRKIELEGVAREHIPDPQPQAKPQPSSPDVEVKVSHVYEPDAVPSTPPPQAEPDWNSLVRDIEVAEDRKHQREAAIKAAREKKVTEAEIQERIQTLRVRAETAKARLIITLIVVPVVLYVCFHLFKYLANLRYGSQRDPLASTIVAILFAALAGLAGHHRRRW